MRQLSALVVLGVLASVLTASDSPAVAQVKKEVEALEAQKKASIKRTHDWYLGIIKHDKINAETLKAERKSLGEQEEELMKTVHAEDVKAFIHSHFESIRALLKDEVKMDAETIHHLKKLEKDHEAVINNSYDPVIQALKAQEKALSAKPKK